MLIIQGSSRNNGNTEYLSNQMTDGIACETVYLRNQQIQPIVDQRHDENGFSPVSDDFTQVVSKMLAHDQILFATPLYWYGMSGLMKNFIDRWSQAIRDQSLDFKEKMKGKKIYVVVVGGASARLKALPLILQFQLIIDFAHCQFKGYVIGEATKPGEMKNDQVGLEYAKAWNLQLKSEISSDKKA